jgi:hypothetical protein
MKSEQNQTLECAICLNNDVYPVALEIGKVYRVILDTEATAHGSLRVIDESGEDYAFTANRFHVVELPVTVGNALLAASRP